MPTPEASNAPESVRQSLSVLHAGYEQFADFLDGILGDFDRLQKELAEAHQQLAARDAASAPVSTEVEQSLRSRIAELEQERSTLEQELEQVRARAVEMAQTVADQKRQLADENSKWTAELRQLRRTLDKQAAWIKQHAQKTQRGEKRRAPTGKPADPQSPAGDDPSLAEDDLPPHADPQTMPASDPVLGDVLSQFELLQRDIARRRSQNSGAAGADTLAPDGLNP